MGITLKYRVVGAPKQRWLRLINAHEAAQHLKGNGHLVHAKVGPSPAVAVNVGSKKSQGSPDFFYRVKPERVPQQDNLSDGAKVLGTTNNPTIIA